MKRIIPLLSIILILSGSFTTLTNAKGGSGGDTRENTSTQTIPEPVKTPEAVVISEPTETPEPQGVPDPVAISEPVVTTREAKEVIPDPIGTPTSTTAVPKTVTKETAPLIPSTTKKAPMLSQEKKSDPSDHCGLKSSTKARVKCRFNANSKTLKYEQENAYFPEGCRTRNSTWQETCKKRYKKIKNCWYDGILKNNSYNAKGMLDCLKKNLSLPKKIVKTSEYCKEKKSDCAENYKNSVYNLIIGRFYDAEERAELLYKEEKISKDQVIEFITFISESKINFINARNKDERVSIIKEVKANWNNLIKNI